MLSRRISRQGHKNHRADPTQKRIPIKFSNVDEGWFHFEISYARMIYLPPFSFYTHIIHVLKSAKMLSNLWKREKMILRNNYLHCHKSE